MPPSDPPRPRRPLTPFHFSQDVKTWLVLRKESTGHTFKAIVEAAVRRDRDRMLRLVSPASRVLKLKPSAPPDHE